MIEKLILITLGFVAAAVDKAALYEWYKGISPENVLYAVTCGSNDPYTDQDGIQYAGDIGYSAG
jgi:hypothetical protein